MFATQDIVYEFAPLVPGRWSLAPSLIPLAPGPFPL